MRINRGEMPMYRVENNHPAIIDMATFEKVQELLAQAYKPRKKKQHNITEGEQISCQQQSKE